MLLYFVAFNILEASLPSLISKQANHNNKGTAMGVYSSCQFLGIFVGGSLAGLLFQHVGITGLFITNTLLSGLWFLFAWPMTIKLSDDQQKKQLTA
jgi:MFS family permease